MSRTKVYHMVVLGKKGCQQEAACEEAATS
jgi:hypothetical protein